jgi:hypothetical protein
MSIHKIPDRYLTTTLDFFRESSVVDSVGDLATVLSLAYASVRANVQSKTETTEFEIQGRVHKQDHVAYINRVETTAREILIGDQVYDRETHTRYMVLGVENWQAANVDITDSHHLKIIMKALWTSRISPFQVTISAKAKIVKV